MEYLSERGRIYEPYLYRKGVGIKSIISKGLSRRPSARLSYLGVPEINSEGCKGLIMTNSVHLMHRICAVDFGTIFEVAVQLEKA